MALPKFIITMDGFLRLGMVNQHYKFSPHLVVLQIPCIFSQLIFLLE